MRFLKWPLNRAMENHHFHEQEIIYRQAIFRSYLKFRECKILSASPDGSIALNMFELPNSVVIHSRSIGWLAMHPERFENGFAQLRSQGREKTNADFMCSNRYVSSFFFAPGNSQNCLITGCNFTCHQDSWSP